MNSKNSLNYEIKKTNNINKETINILVNLILKGVGHYIKNPLLRHAKTRSLSSNKNNFILAKNSEKIIGFLMYRIDNKLSFLYEIHVDSEYRTKGVGKKLMEEYFNDQKNKELILFVHHNNFDAQKFYSNLDFNFDKSFTDKHYFKMTRKN